MEFMGASPLGLRAHRPLPSSSQANPSNAPVYGQGQPHFMVPCGYVTQHLALLELRVDEDGLNVSTGER